MRYYACGRIIYRYDGNRYQMSDLNPYSNSLAISQEDWNYFVENSDDVKELL